MKTAELIQVRKLQLIEGQLPEPGPGEIQVRVRAVGICGSDMHDFSEGRVGDVACDFPMVLGHEPTGTVVKTGSGVTGWAPGDRTAIEPAIYCYHCEFCLTGRHNICEHIRFHSSPADPGFFRDHANVLATNLMPLPAEIGFREGTLFEPLAVVLHSTKLAAVRPLETAAVFGAGPIGLMTVALLKLSGAGRVFSIEPVAHRREMARIVGADAVIDPLQIDPAREIMQTTGKRGVDMTFDCATKDDTLDQCVAATRNGGRMIVTGISVELRLPLQWHAARRKELTIYNVRRSVHESETALELIREHPKVFAPIITHSYPMEKIQPAFEMLETFKDGAGKVIIEP